VISIGVRTSSGARPSLSISTFGCRLRFLFHEARDELVHARRHAQYVRHEIQSEQIRLGDPRSSFPLVCPRFPSALASPGLDPDRHIIAALTVRAPGEVPARVFARQLVDPDEGLIQFEGDDLSPDFEVAARAR
jgi:hypothetical protein